MGCASVYTAGENPKDDVGVAYYMPNRAIRIEVAIDKEGVRTPKALSGDAYADTSRRFLIRSEGNLVGATSAKLVVNGRGLLTSAAGETKGEVGEALKNLATSAGGLGALESGRSRAECASNTTHSVDLPLERLTFQPVGAERLNRILGTATPASPDAEIATGMSFCGYDITILRLFKSGMDGADAGRFGHARAGLYYRQSLPYLVLLSRTVTTPAAPPATKGRAKASPAAAPAAAPVSSFEQFTFLVHSPTGAPIQLAPVPRGLFASSAKASLTFSDGVLEGYDRSTDGELVSALKLPSDVLGAYSTALASGFQTRKTRETNETEERLQENARALTDLRIQLCREAVAAKDNARIEAACATPK